MNTRRLKESDWDTLQEWWNGWPGWTPPEKSFLPDNGTGGLIVEKDNKPIVAGFIFLGIDLKIAYFGWIVSNPKYREKDRRALIELLIEKTSKEAKKHGVSQLFTVCGDPHMSNIHNSLDWIMIPVKYEGFKYLINK